MFYQWLFRYIFDLNNSLHITFIFLEISKYIFFKCSLFKVIVKNRMIIV